MADHPLIIDAGFGAEGSAPGESPLVVLRELRTQVEELRKLDQRRAGEEALRTRLLALFGGLITAAAIAAFTWVWSIQADMGAAQGDIRRNAERLEDHRRQGGPMGHPESVIARTATNEGRITANTDGIRRVEGRLDGIEDKIDEVLERLPRRTR